MSTIQIIQLTFVSSLVFLLGMGTYLYRKRKKQESLFIKNYPLLIQSIKKKDVDKSLQILRLLQWNPNMEFLYYQEFKSELEKHTTAKEEAYNEILEMVDDVYERKGWKNIS